MSKIRDGTTFYKQYNKAQRIEETRRIAEQASKTIREKLQHEIEKAKLKKVERSG